MVSLIYESIILLHHHTKTCKFQTYLDTQPTKTVDIYIHIHVYLQQLKWSSYRHEPQTQTILNICEKLNGFMIEWYICTLAFLSNVNSIILSHIATVIVDISLKYISKLIFGLKIFSMLILSLNKSIFVDFSMKLVTRLAITSINSKTGCPWLDCFIDKLMNLK